MGAFHVENVADLACRTALEYRGVAHLAFPVDLQEAPAASLRSKRNIGYHTSDTRVRNARLPAAEDLSLAADILNTGRRVAILSGRGALGASAEVEAAAERMGAPIVKALLSKGAVPAPP